MITHEEAGKAYSYVNGLLGCVGKPLKVTWNGAETVQWLEPRAAFEATLTLNKGTLSFEMFVDIENDSLDFGDSVWVTATKLREFFSDCKAEFRRLSAAINNECVLREADLKHARSVRSQIKKFATHRV